MDQEEEAGGHPEIPNHNKVEMWGVITRLEQPTYQPEVQSTTELSSLDSASGLLFLRKSPICSAALGFEGRLLTKNSFFLAAIIIFSYVSSTTNTAVVAAGKPDRSTKSAIIDILLFMPGVTASLVTFLVFGTAKSWRQYRDLLVGGCGIRNKIVQRKFLRQRDGRGNGGSNEEGLEFAPLPRLETTPSLQERIKREEATKRVQMFAREVRREIGLTERPDTAVAGLTSDAQTPGTYTRGAPSPDLAIDADLDLRKSYHQRRYSNPFPAVGGTSGGKNLQFHRPRPSIDTAGIGSTRAPVSSYGVIDVGFGRREDDQVVRPEWEGTRDERRDSYR